MTELLTAAQMRAVERAAIESGAVTGLELMERAGRGVVAAIFDEWPELQAAPHRAVVLCGPGNNGGDGFVVARLLREWGWTVEVFLLGDPEKLPADARVNYERWVAMGAVAPLDAYPDDDGSFDLYVDALFGTGLGRPVVGRAAEILSGYSASPHHSGRLVCIDIQSGLCADSGRVLGGQDRPAAALTVTFHSAKPGHHLADGAWLSGKLAVADIGLPEDWRRSDAFRWSKVARLQERPDAFGAVHLSKDRQPRSGHKYTHGHALVLSGPMGRSGAARLAARGALRIGAGLVTVAAPGSAMLECACQLTAIMLRKCDGAGELAALLEDARLNAVCLGPGLGVTPGTRALVAAALGAPPPSDSAAVPPPSHPSPTGEGSRAGPADGASGGGAARRTAPPPSGPEGGGGETGRRSVVLDADALTAFAEDPGALFAMLHPRSVLTPHAGEFARLFPDIAEKLNAPATTGPACSKLDATREAAARAGCTVLFKGADTVIADQTGAARISSAQYDRAAPWLATAGSGDVLAGMIAGLLARGFAPLDAAATAAWLHVEAARAFGPGLIAEDLPEMLPRVLSGLWAE